MSPTGRPPDEREMREYLLGRLTQERRDELLEQFFSDERSYDAMLEAEHDLIDEYARGHLNTKDARDVESGLLASAEKRDDLSFARALWRAERQRKLPRRDSRRWLIAAAAAVAAIGISAWLAAQNDKLRNELAGVRQKNSSQELQMDRQAKQAAQPVITAFALFPQVRGPSMPTLEIAPNVDLVRFDFADVKGAGTYGVDVMRNGAVKVWSGSDLEGRSSGTLTVWLSRDLLSSGSYEFLVYGQTADRRELAAAYQCRIVRR